MAVFVENSWLIYLILTFVLGGGAAYAMGRSLALGWRPGWHLIILVLLLGVSLRFLQFALFDGELLSLHYYLTDTMTLALCAAVGSAIPEPSRWSPAITGSIAKQGLSPGRLNKHKTLPSRCLQEITIFLSSLHGRFGCHTKPQNCTFNTEKSQFDHERRNRQMKSTIATLSVLALGAMFSAKASADIAVATAGPMTGQYASFGAQMKAGAEMAVQDINAAGGVLGQQLRLFIEDDVCDPKQAVSVANKIASEGVVFVAGHFCSGSSIPASKVYTEEGIVQISPGSTNPKFTDEGAWNIFRVCGRDDQQGGTAAEFIVKQLADKKIAIIHDKTAYGKGLSDEVKATMERAGKTPDMYEAITAGEKDYSALVTKLKASGIHYVFLGGYHTEGGSSHASCVSRAWRRRSLVVTLW